jgi:hypothetical protein
VIPEHKDNAVCLLGIPEHKVMYFVFAVDIDIYGTL